MDRKLYAAVLVTVGVLLTLGTAQAQFQGCGRLVTDVEGGCLLFNPFSGGSYTLDYYGEFHTGDVVRVAGDFGTISNPCPPCGMFQYPCILNVAITVCETSTGCCEGRVGDANGMGGDEPTIGDLSVLIDAKFISGTCDGILVCLLEADVNQSGGCNPTCADITIGDISSLIEYLFLPIWPPANLTICIECPL